MLTNFDLDLEYPSVAETEIEYEKDSSEDKA